MEYLPEERNALQALRSWHVFTRKRRSALPIPKETGRLTMATFLLSSVESCEGGHGLCYHLLEKRRSALQVLRSRG